VADLNWAGISGLKVPAETSPNTSAAPNLRETTDNEGEASITWTSRQDSCAKTSSRKLMGCASATAGSREAGGRGSDGKLAGGMDRTSRPAGSIHRTMGGGQERASETTLAEPGVWLRSVVNSEM
jgi:hypothetical protein